MKNLKKIVLLLGVFLACTGLASAVDVPWQWIHQSAIEKAEQQIKTLLDPFSAENGFPGKRPVALAGKSWEATYKAAALAAEESRRIMTELIGKSKFPVRIRLGAQYFEKRLAIGAKLFPQFAGNERAHELFCRDFAKACAEGLLELRFWRSAEPIMTFDMLWAKNIREGLPRVLALLPTMPENVPADQAQKIWRDAAKAALAAANEAGMTAAKVGGFDFPAWRLKYCVKYFKAALREVIVGQWDVPRNANIDWVKSCEQLRTRVAALPAEMDELLNSLPK